MWLAIWLIFSVFLLTFVGWTLAVLFQQKKAWKAFAEKNGLTFIKGALTASPAVTGRLHNRPFSLYSDTQQTNDMRGQRYVTVIEFQMGKGLPTGAIIATKELKIFADNLVFDETYLPDVEGWDASHIVRTRDKINLEKYLTKERATLLGKLFKMRNVVALYFFDELESVLRVETTDPLRDAAHLQKIIDQIMLVVRKLTPSVEERKLYQQLQVEAKERAESKHPDNPEHSDQPDQPENPEKQDDKTQEPEAPEADKQETQESKTEEAETK